MATWQLIHDFALGAKRRGRPIFRSPEGVTGESRLLCGEGRPESASGSFVDPSGFEEQGAQPEKALPPWNQVLVGIRDAVKNVAGEAKQVFDNAGDQFVQNVKKAGTLISNVNDKLKGRAQKAGLTVTGILSGDIFDKETFNYFPTFDAEKANSILISINGIRTDEKGART